VAAPNRRLFQRSSSEEHVKWLKQHFLTRLRDVVDGKLEPGKFAQDLADQIDKLEQDRIRDPLTGAFNRGFIGAVMGQELALAKKSGQLMGFLILDLDHFKSINDTEPDGHAAGDRALIEAVKILREICGNHSLVGRWGGEEFVVITPHVTHESFLEMAQDLGESISGWLAKNAKLVKHQVTTSMGAILTDGNQEVSAVIETADKLLYQAKHTGRSRLVMDRNGVEVVVKFN
jgi:diguanylate cyclase (GGDEF)-like protein